MRWLATALLLCASNSLADITGFGAPPSVGGSGETNTYTSSKTFTQDVLLRGTGRLTASSGTFTYGISAGTGTFSSTVAVRGDAFSVGTSTLSISAGNFAFGAAAPSVGNYVTVNPPSKTLSSPPGSALSTEQFTYTHATAAGVVGNSVGTVRIKQGTYKTTGGGASSYNDGGSLLIDSPPSGTSGTSFASSSTILMGGDTNHKIGVAVAGSGLNGGVLVIEAGSAGTLLEEDHVGGSLLLKSGRGYNLSGTGTGNDGDIRIDPNANGTLSTSGRILLSQNGGNVGIATAAPASLFTIGNGTFSVQGGSATVAYRMTAASFSGDGSNLTNLPSAEGNTYASSKTFTSDVLLRGTGKISASSATFTYGISAGTGTFSSTITANGDLIFSGAGVYSLQGNQFAFSGKRLGFDTSGLYFNVTPPGYQFRDLLGNPAQHFSADGTGNYFTGTTVFGTNTSLTGGTIESVGPGTSAASFSLAAFNNDYSHFVAFDDAGHLAIDKVSPAYSLDVAGDVRTSGQEIIEGTATVKGARFSVGTSSFSVVGGSVTVAYRVTAGSFSGDGANLTNVPATFTGGTVANQTTFLSSVTINQGLISSTGTFTSTVTVQGNAFSVGGSSFSVLGGSVTTAYQQSARSFNVTASTVPTVYGVTKVQTTSNQVFYSSAALPVNLGSDITGLAFALAANTSYYFEYDIMHQSTATTTGIWFGMTYPAASTITWSVTQYSSLSAALFRFSRGAEFTTLSGTDVDVADQPVPAKITGTITVGKTPGNLQPRVKCELQTGRGQINAGSSGRLEER